MIKGEPFQNLGTEPQVRHCLDFAEMVGLAPSSSNLSAASVSEHADVVDTPAELHLRVLDLAKKSQEFCELAGKPYFFTLAE